MNKPPTAPANRPRPAPTIRDVARVANVSIGTASKALNRSGSLREETRNRVLAAAKQLGFRPNDLAQALHRGQSSTVGLISNDSFGRFTMPIMEGLEACLSDEGVAVFMCNATDDPERERRHLEQLLGKRVDGLVFTARRADRRPAINLELAGVPVVHVFAQSNDPDSLALLPDDEGGAYMATRYLLDMGRTRIAYVTGPDRFEAVGLRHKGYRRALKEAGVAVPEGYSLKGDWSEQWGREAIERLFDGSGPMPQALFCGNDQIARGASDELRERGIDVPNTVSIVGFDNWEVIAEAARPPLTSIDMNLFALGEAAGRSILAMIKGEHLTGVKRLPCSLIERASCAPLKT